MGRRKKGDPVHGWVILDKASGMGSTPSVSMVKRYFNAQKAGHGGALDPFASGVLPIGLGEATKTMPYILNSDKEYEFTIRWGEETDTLDIDGEVIETSAERPGVDDIVSVLQEFVGEIEQAPPAYSSIKVDGKRAYDLARSGEAVDLPPRPVVIHSLSLLQDEADDIGPHHATFHMECGKGTYVRSLGRDLARRLGTVGHIGTLRRLRVGPFDIEDAIEASAFDGQEEKPDDELGLENKGQREDKPPRDRLLLPIQAALDGIPALSITEVEALRLRNGQAVSLLRKLDLERVRAFEPEDVLVAMMDDRYSVDEVAVAMVRFEKGALHPIRLFNL